MAKGKGQGKKIVFDDRWVELYLDKFKEYLYDGMNPVIALVKLDSWALPKNFLELTVKAEAADNLETLSPSEWKVYRVFKLAQEESPVNLRMNHKIGRPTLKNEETKQLLLLALKAGLTDEAACGYAGITVVTFWSWRKEDEDFLKEVECARNFGKAKLELDALRETGRDSSHALKVLKQRFKDWQDSLGVNLDKDSQDSLKAVAKALVSVGFKDKGNQEAKDDSSEK